MLGAYCQNLLFRKLFRLRGGCIRILDRGTKRMVGERGHHRSITVTVHRPVFYQRIVLGGGLGAAESYMDGDWSCDDLTLLIQLFARNLDSADGLNRGLGLFRNRLVQFQNRFRRNSVRQAKRNIHDHYDLGNDFFSQFLDSTMSYSAGIFQRPQDSMLLASIHKMWRICKKLELSNEDHLLEIGTGWAGLAIFAARVFECRVTTTTISEEQFLYAKSSVAAAGLQDRITVLKKDYRDLTGKYDKLVSVEMIEAVGHEYLDTFFAKCQSLLELKGLMLLQSIVIRDQRYQSHLQNTDFIKKYIFPGGCLPSNRCLLQSVERNTDFQVRNLEDIGQHYAQTIACWKKTFQEGTAAIQEIGFSDPRFIAMWNYYLCYCEAGFLESQISNIQILFAGPQASNSVDPESWQLQRTQLVSLSEQWPQIAGHNVAQSDKAFSTDSFGQPSSPHQTLLASH